MGWPKGKPRKGHINPDGTPHKAKGEKLRVGVGLDVRRVPVGTNPFAPVPRKRRVRSNVPNVSPQAEAPVEKVWPLEGNRPVTEKCPNCGYLYADGGYCSECHWMAAITRDPYDTNRGRKFK